MSNTFNKIAAVGLSLATATWLSGGVMIASAQTVSIQDLLNQIAALQAQILSLQGSQTSSSAYSFTRDLTVGSKGDDVKALQQTLINSGDLAISTPTSFFGSMTQAALVKYQSRAGISPAAGYFGPKTRAYVNSLGVGTGTGTGTGTVVPSGPFSLVLASDNPASAALPKGATGVAVLKFNVVGTGTLNSIVFKRQGLGATADFGSSGFYLFDGSTRLTTGKSLNSTTHEVSFINLNLAVSGTKTVTLAADISATATPGDISQFVLVSAAGNPTPAGTLVGNSMSIASATVGTITATSGAAPSNPAVGQKAAKIAEFILTAGAAEDINIGRIALTEGGSIANANLTNLVLKQAGNTIATASGIGEKDLVTFQLTSPFVLEKGQVRTFEVYSDIAGTTRSSDQIVLYFDSAADVYAVGKLYNYPVTPTISALDATSDGDTLTVQGGQLTITLNGPVTGDIALRGQDVEVFNFTIAAQNNVEIRNLRLGASTTLLDVAGEGFNDFKVWDTALNAVVTSATDVSTSTNVTFTDVININAGQSRTFKVTVDVDPDSDSLDTLRVDLLAFQSNDVRNLDNNTYVATTSIVPSTNISGNAQTVKVQTLDVQLPGTPASQTIVKGTQNVSLVGFSFRAIAGDIRIASVRVTATASSGTLTSGEITSLGLYDGTTLVSDSLKSLDATALNATFNLSNYIITQGATKVLTVKGNVDSSNTNNDVIYVKLATVTADDITAYDKDGNVATLTGTAANSGGTVAVSITGVGDVTVAVASDDTESEAGIITAGQELVLAKFRVTSANEEMRVNKMQLLVVPTGVATATSSASADEVSVVKLYDGSTLIGSSAGYSVTGSGDNSGTVYIEGLNWSVGKDVSKTLTVKGVVNTIANGADSGASVYASVMAAGFEAQGATAKDTTITAATGNQKVVYKTKPTFATPTIGSDGKLATGSKSIMKFKIKADGPEQVAWKQIQLQVSMTGATMSAVNAVPGTTGNVILSTSGSNLNLASAFSSLSTTTGEQVAITGGNTGYVSLLLSSEQTITAGTEKEYELSLTFADVSGTVGAASAQVKLWRTETVLVNASTVTGVRSSLGTATDAAPSFVWSDYSATNHSESTADWANSFLVKVLPSTSITISNN